MLRQKNYLRLVLLVVFQELMGLVLGLLLDQEMGLILVLGMCMNRFGTEPNHKNQFGSDRYS